MTETTRLASKPGIARFLYTNICRANTVKKKHNNDFVKPNMRIISN